MIGCLMLQPPADGQTARPECRKPHRLMGMPSHVSEHVDEDVVDGMTLAR